MEINSLNEIRCITGISLFQHIPLHYRIIARRSYWFLSDSRAVPAIEQTSPEVRNDPRKWNSIFPQREFHRSFLSPSLSLDSQHTACCLEWNKNASYFLKKKKKKNSSRTKSTSVICLMTYFRIIHYLSCDKQSSIHILIEILARSKDLGRLHRRLFYVGLGRSSYHRSVYADDTYRSLWSSRKGLLSMDRHHRGQ